MKAIHLIPLLFLTFNYTGKPVPANPNAVAHVKASTFKKKFAVENDKLIPWTPHRKLIWDDFLQEPEKEGEAVASTSTSLGLSYQVRDNQLVYQITCDFSKEKSWGILKTDYILAHEQAHFDITEIHARKLHQALTNFTLNAATAKTDIAEIYNRVVKEKETMQHTYDQETDHSRKKERQAAWLQKIEKTLLDTLLFSTYP